VSLVNLVAFYLANHSAPGQFLIIDSELERRWLNDFAILKPDRIPKRFVRCFYQMEFHRTVWTGNGQKVARLYLQKGAKPEGKTSGKTALHSGQTLERYGG